MNNRLIYISLAGFMLIFLAGCQQEKKTEREYPQIRTLAVDQITPEGARFNAAIISGDVETITEHGFVWGQYDMLTLSTSDKISVEEAPESDQYSIHISSSLVAMKEYFVRSYIKAGQFIVYGDPVKFTSLGSMAPVITDFEPKAASWGDTITIYGKNFSSQPFWNTVHFGNLIARVISCTNETLKVQVPDVTNIYSEISEEVLGNRAVATKLFELITPGKITAIDKKNITWADTLTLTGIFPFSKYTLKILMDKIPAVILESSETKIKMVVPPNLKYYDSVTVDLSINSHLVQASEKSHMIQPYISSVGNGEFGWGDTIIIKGLFSPARTANKILFSNIQSTILDLTRNGIRCIVPDIGLNHTATLTIETGGLSVNYGPTLSLSGPVINKISPGKAAANTYLTISGKYFRDGQTTLMIGNQAVNAYVINSRSMSTELPVLEARGYVTVIVKVYNKQNSFSNILYYLNPAITGINPKMGTFGDIITVSGTDFDPDNLSIYFESGGNPIEALEKSTTMVKFAIPNDGIPYYSRIIINTGGATASSSDRFTVYPPRIDMVTPIEGVAGDVIRITGDYFNPVDRLNTVYIGGIQVVNNSSSRNYIEFNMPDLLGGDYPIQVQNGTGSATNYTEPFHCNIPWRNVPNFTDYGRLFSSSFAYDDKIWRIGGLGNSFSINSDISIYSLNSNSTSWAYSETSMANTFAFAIDTYGYFGLGVTDDQHNTVYSKSIKRIDLTNQVISNLPDFPGNVRKYSFSFSLLSEGYVGSGMNADGLLGDFWKFDPATSNWIRLTDLPFGQVAGATAIAMNDKAYVVSGNELWEYNPNLNSWTQKANFPGIARYHGTGFSSADKVYFGTGSDKLDAFGMNETYMNDLWQYNSSNDTWTRMMDIPYHGRTGVYCNSYNGKGYFGGGYYYSPGGFVYITYLLEYDPLYE
jgi:N-acetylneuraminic acid mutarotase